MNHHPVRALVRAIAATLVLALFAVEALAQDTTAPAPPPAPVGQAGAKAGAGGAQAAEGKGDADATPSPPASSKPSPQHFEPTEKVRPDFDVAFPVDI